MATDTVTVVPSFTSKFGIEDSKSYQGLDLNELDYKNGYHGSIKRHGMPLDELGATTKERDYTTRVKKSRDSENEEKSKENEDLANNANKTTNIDVKKKRTVRKRNRSDMSPEELKRLRERERKAQQSRRDRIRAQKVGFFLFI